MNYNEICIFALHGSLAEAKRANLFAFWWFFLANNILKRTKILMAYISLFFEDWSHLKIKEHWEKHT